MAEIWLVCEGTSDFPVLTAVLTTVLAAEISVRAAGGNSNIASVAAYLRKQDDSSTVAYVFDRDYSRRATADATFTDGRPAFMWRRHAIESYRKALLDEAARLVAKAQATIVSPHLEPLAIGRRYDAELARLTAADYLRDMTFLEEFHGRDLLGALCQWLQQIYRAKLSKKLLVEELEKAVPDAYKANRLLYGTDDFLDLANGVRALAKLPQIV